MAVTIALAGNPNCGKTTLFNALTGSNQFVGNWPGVTVEKKEGKLKGRKDVVITDLPGIYSLSPYTLEEIVARNYLLAEKPDVILNIVDGTNIERNLYLTTQLLELGIPVVLAVNMMDLLKKSGDRINTELIGKKLGCKVFEISALKETGIMEAAAYAIDLVEKADKPQVITGFTGRLEQTIREVEGRINETVTAEQKRFFAIKLLEQDEKISSNLPFAIEISDLIEDLENAFDDDAESIITNERYQYITRIVQEGVKKQAQQQASLSDKIDSVVTNRWLALPIFAVVMFLVYYISVTTVGTWATDWANDGVFGEGWHLFGIESLFIPGIPVLIENILTAVNTAPWLQSLVLDGIVAGVGAVLGFVPQMLVLFAFLAFLEACGYMARVAFIMDRIFRKFGLSGKSFIPMLVGSGCGVPGIMASRTIESDRDRKMTIMTTTFIPCGAKLPIIALISGALFGGAWWVAPSAYFVGIGAVIVSGIILKKTRLFSGDPAPFVMELPAYHMPTVKNILRSMWERGYSFIRKAGTIILLSTVVLWFLMSFGFVDGGFTMLDAESLNNSILAIFGRVLAPLFTPLGWGDWKASVAALTGLIAKENVVGTFGVLYGFGEVAENGGEIWGSLAMSMTALGAYSFLVFNLLCAPCFAAMGAIRREMNHAKWFWIAIGYQTLFAYASSLLVFQLGNLILHGIFGFGTVLALFVLAAGLYLMFRPLKNAGKSIKKEALKWEQ
ncbi:MAG: ferrous iron transport protein B [Lachnospiraceae bacterium]